MPSNKNQHYVPNKASNWGRSRVWGDLQIEKDVQGKQCGPVSGWHLG